MLENLTAKLEELSTVLSQRPALQSTLLSKDSNDLIKRFDAIINQDEELNISVCYELINMAIKWTSSPRSDKYTDDKKLKNYIDNQLMNELTGLILALGQDCHALADAVSNSDNRHLVTKLEQKDTELNQIISEKQELESRLHEIERSNERLKKDLEQVKEIHKENIQHLERKLKTQQEKLKAAVNEGGDIEGLELDIEQLNKKLNRAKQDKANAEEELDKLESENKKLKNLIKDLEESKNRLQIENTGLYDRLRVLENTKEAMLQQSQNVMSQSMQMMGMSQSGMTGGAMPNMSFAATMTSANTFSQSFAITDMNHSDGYFAGRLSYHVDWMNDKCEANQSRRRILLYLTKEFDDIDKSSKGNVHVKLFTQLIMGILFRPEISLKHVFTEVSNSMGSVAAPEKFVKLIRKLQAEDAALQSDNKPEYSKELPKKVAAFEKIYNYLFSETQIQARKDSQQKIEPFLPKKLHTEMLSTVKAFITTEKARATKIKDSAGQAMLRSGTTSNGAASESKAAPNKQHIDSPATLTK